MAKLFFAVLLAVLAAVSFAQRDECPQRFRDTDTQCQREVQQIPLHACRQLLDLHLSGLRVAVPSWMRPWQPRAQCCLQLQDVSPECRCAAIGQVVRSLEQSVAPLEGGGYGGEVGGQGQQQQEGCGYGGARRQQGGCGGYGETGRQQAGGGRCDQTKQNRGYIGFPPRTGAAAGEQTTHVRLGEMRVYARQLPAMCRIEPQECSSFAAGPYYSA